MYLVVLIFKEVNAFADKNKQVINQCKIDFASYLAVGHFVRVA